MNGNITAHFTWHDVTFSETAIRHGLDNNPPDDLLPNIQRMARFMEELRLVMGAQPIFISSWFRSPEVNTLIGGSSTSMHMRGLACDCLCPMLGTPLRFAQEIEKSKLDYDQVIHEFGRWVHIGLAEGNRRESLTAYLQNGKTVYVPGLVEIP